MLTTYKNFKVLSPDAMKKIAGGFMSGTQCKITADTTNPSCSHEPANWTCPLAPADCQRAADNLCAKDDCCSDIDCPDYTGN